MSDSASVEAAGELNSVTSGADQFSVTNGYNCGMMDGSKMKKINPSHKNIFKII